MTDRLFTRRLRSKSRASDVTVRLAKGSADACRAQSDEGADSLTDLFVAGPVVVQDLQVRGRHRGTARASFIDQKVRSMAGRAR